MKKSLIIGLTVLSVMMFAGTAYSVEGPSPIVVFPFICEVPTGMLPVNFEHLDMFYTIANASFFEVQPLGMNVLVKVRSYKGDILLNDSMHLSIRDVGRQTCSGEIGKMQAANRSQMVQTVGGKQYYVGYIEYAVSDPASGEKIIGWGEMETLRTQKVGSIGGSLKLKEWLYTDAGFNGVPDFYDDAGGSVFNGYYITSNLGLLPRYNIANADPDTHNWWIIMTPSNAQRPPDGTCGRILGGTICNEDEVCLGTILVQNKF